MPGSVMCLKPEHPMKAITETIKRDNVDVFPTGLRQHTCGCREGTFY